MSDPRPDAPSAPRRAAQDTPARGTGRIAGVLLFFPGLAFVIVSVIAIVTGSAIAIGASMLLLAVLLGLMIFGAAGRRDLDRPQPPRPTAPGSARRG